MPDTTEVVLVNSSKTEPIRLLEDREDIRLRVVTEAPYAHLYSTRTEVHTVACLDDLSAVQAVVMRLARQRPVTAVLGASERSLPVAAYLRTVLGLPGTSFDTVNLFTNKYAMKRRLAEAGVPVAVHRRAFSLEEATEAAADLGWPVVLKPAFGAGSVDTFVVEDADAMRDLAGSAQAEGLRRARCPVVVEAFVDMKDEYHCDGVVQGGRTQFLSVARYFDPLLRNLDKVSGSITVPEGSPGHEEATRLHDAVVAALGLESGVTHLELFGTSRGFTVGEITCRPGGGGIAAHVGLQYGVDLWDAFVRAELNEPISAVGRDRGGIVAHCQLPVRVGTVSRITSEEEFLALDHVIGVDMRLRPGDTVAGTIHSSRTAGLVHLRADSEDAALRSAQAVARLFRIDVAQPGL